MISHRRELMFSHRRELMISHRGKSSSNLLKLIPSYLSELETYMTNSLNIITLKFHCKFSVDSVVQTCYQNKTYRIDVTIQIFFHLSRRINNWSRQVMCSNLLVLL